MRTRISGRLSELGDTEATIDVGAFAYAVYVPDFVRRQLQGREGQEISLRTIEYLAVSYTHLTLPTNREV